MKRFARVSIALLAAGSIPLLIAVLAAPRRGEPAIDAGIRAISLVGALAAFPLSIGLGRYPTLQELFAISPAQRLMCIAFVVIVWIGVALALLAVWHLLRPVWLSMPARARRIALTVGCAACLIGLIAPLIPPPGPVRVAVDAGRSIGPIPDIARDFSQGGHGEMRTPGYFETALGRIAPLRPRLVRIDHVYDYYDVYSVDAGGNSHYDWSKLDRLVRAIRDAGAEPLICLSYLPPDLSHGDPYALPTNLTRWEALVYQTVRHFNAGGEGRIAYWEVWNEPNTGNFWHGSADDYAALYEATARAVRRADPLAKVGGPGAFSLERYGPAFELINEKSLVDALVARVRSKGLPLDFLSWHLYEKYPGAYPENIRRHRSWLAGVSPPPELLLTEWNWSAEPTADYDTGATGAFIAGTSAALADTPLAGAFFFEPIDSAAGEWGLLRPDGSAKPAYHVFEMMSALRGDRLAITTTSADVGAMAALDGGIVRVLVWNLGERPARVELALRGLHGMGAYSATVGTGDGQQMPAGLRVEGEGQIVELVVAARGVQMITVRAAQ